jgi:large subunit ribosomal protein L37Ae
MSKTKKAKSTARFGARYGKGIKEVVKKLEAVKKFTCPRCGKRSVKKKGYALWGCSKCGARFAGGAYMPQTDLGRISARIIKAPEKAQEILAEEEKAKAVEEDKTEKAKPSEEGA